MAETKYYNLYTYFKKLILSGSLEKGSKMPSIRDCSKSFELSRTTVETAYEMLSAEGYIYPVSQSGYYVSDVQLRKSEDDKKNSENNIRFNLTNSSADKDSFNFALWRRYVKSALRQDERLLSYGQTQGEEDLREAISRYVNKQRGLICSANQIVISAGTQSLISILCALTPEKKTVAFAGANFSGGQAVFEDYGKKIYEKISEENPPSIIYTSPSCTDDQGSVMSTKDRRKLLDFEKRHSCLIIEDDYDSEFRINQKHIPSLQSMNGGENVVYIGTFSRLLIPSIRISFMVLPYALLNKYQKRMDLYNQTASKAEQIALCQYIRDGHLSSIIKKQRKQYIQKTSKLCQMGNDEFKGDIIFEACDAVYMIKLHINSEKRIEDIVLNCEENGLSIKALDNEFGSKILVASVTGFDLDKFQELAQILKKSCF